MQKSRLSSDFIGRCEDRVRDQYSERLQGEDAEELLVRMISDLHAVRIENSQSALESFFRILLILELNSELQLLKERDKSKLQELGESCLRMAQIQATRSHHSHLYQRLYLLLSQQKAHDGQPWQSLVFTMIGQHLARDAKDDPSVNPKLRAVQSWQLGHLRLAKIALHTAELEAPKNPGEQWEIDRLLIRAYRLSGDLEMATKRLYQPRMPSSDLALEQELEMCILHLLQVGSSRELVSFLNRSAQNLSPFDVYLAQLWLYASPQKMVWKDLKLSAAFKTRLQRQCRQGIESQAAELIVCLEQLYHHDSPLQQRFELLGRRLTHIRSIPDPEIGLLFLSAVIRWLYRSKQAAFAAGLIEEYKALSLNYSDGKTLDSLGLLGDLVEALPIALTKEMQRDHGELFAGSTPRFLKLAQLVSKLVFHYGRMQLLRKRDPILYQEQESAMVGELLELCKETTGEFKGPPMKIMQMLTVRRQFSEEHRRILLGIYDEAPPLPLDDMRRQAELELGQSLDSLFQWISPQPLAVASMGQVYKARLHDGRDVALKLMYPELARIVASDLKLLQLFRPLLRSFMSSEEFEQTMDQVRQGLSRECDYRIEAQVQQEFYQHFAGDPEIQVPRVFPEWCTKSMLVSEYMDGVRPHVYLRNADPEQRDQLARKIYRFMVLCQLRHGLLQTDPHLANFLVCKDRLVVLDFGAVLRLNMDQRIFCWNYHRLRLERDAEGLYDLFHERGYIQPDAMKREEFNVRLAPVLIRPFDRDGPGPYLGPKDLSIRDHVLKHRLYDVYRPRPGDFYQVLTNQFLEEIFSCIGAELNWREELERLFAEMQESAVSAGA